MSKIKIENAEKSIEETANVQDTVSVITEGTVENSDAEILRRMDIEMRMNDNKPENIKIAKQYVKSGKMSEETLQELREIDPSKNKKYVNWMSRMYIKNNFNPIDFKSYIEEYHVLSEKSKFTLEQRDYDKFKTVDELIEIVDYFNNTGNGLSNKDYENDYDEFENDDIYVGIPYSHEASRKLGLSKFNFRKNETTGTADCQWCTTYATNSHFDSYFYSNGITFYYVLVKNHNLIHNAIKEYNKDHNSNINFDNKYTQLAFVVHKDNKVEVYDANDKPMDYNLIVKFAKHLGLQIVS